MDPTATTAPPEQSVEQAQRSILMEVSNAMVQLFKEQFGRGPTKARSNWAGRDTLVCVLRESFTPAEKNMVALGEHQRLRDVRLFFQAASEEQFRGVVERIVGRPVESFMSAIDTHTDTAIEVFIFEPDEPRDEPPDP
jgi:uncharacterized protein YbcI